MARAPGALGDALTIMARGIVTRDSALRNTLVSWDPVGTRYRPYVIDFGGYQLREEFFTEEGWRSAQWEETEEDNIGVYTQHLLNVDRGGGYVYH
jgi:hypothetical protein